MGLLSAIAQYPGYYLSATETLVDLARWLGENRLPIIGNLVRNLYLVVLFYLLPLLPFAVVYFALRYFGWITLDTSALAGRLWRIVAGVFILVALNYTVLGIESVWAAGWAR